MRKIVALIGLIALCAGCGPTMSIEERISERTSLLYIEREKLLAEEKTAIAPLEERFKAVYFPPDDITVSSYSYEMQKFFDAHYGENIIFAGYVDDIEALADKALVEFVCPIGDSSYGVAMRLRLKLPMKYVEELLTAERAHPLSGSFERFFSHSYFIVAEITKVHKARKYVYDEYGDEVEMEPEISKGLIGTGQLIHIEERW